MWTGSLICGLIEWILGYKYKNKDLNLSKHNLTVFEKEMKIMILNNIDFEFIRILFSNNNYY